MERATQDMTPNSSRRGSRLMPVAIAVATLTTYAARRRRRSLRSAALRGPVTISDNALGVPTIVAGCRDDALFGLGYVVARDRPFQIDVLRRVALGQLSELIGMPAVVQAAASDITSDERSALEAFAAGVNARWRQAALPLEFRALRYRPDPWAIEDSLSIGKLMGWTLGANPYADLAAE